MSKKYEKFELEELSKSAVVNSLVHAKNQEVDELINEAVSEHLSKIADEVEEGKEKSSELIKKSIDDSLKPFNMSAEDSTQEQELGIDIDEIKTEFYQKGLEEAKAKYEAIISEKDSENNFSQRLFEKLSLISQTVDIDAQIAKV